MQYMRVSVVLLKAVSLYLENESGFSFFCFVVLFSCTMGMHFIIRLCLRKNKIYDQISLNLFSEPYLLGHTVIFSALV